MSNIFSLTAAAPEAPEPWLSARANSVRSVGKVALFFPLALLAACQRSEPGPIAPQSQPEAASAAGKTSPTVMEPSPEVTTTTPEGDSIAPQPTAPAKSPWALAVASADNPPEPMGGEEDLTQSQGRTSVSGCLASAAQPATRGGNPQRDAPPNASQEPLPAQPWRAVALRDEVVVTHHLEHACCLQGKAIAKVEGQRIVIEERLTGQPCRCVCTSTIETRLNVPPGSYEVETVTVTNGARQVAHSGRVVVALSKRP